MCACYMDIDLQTSDGYEGYPRNCSPSNPRRPGREMKFSDMIPPSFLLDRIQQTSRRPKAKSAGATAKEVGTKSCKCKRSVGVNTCNIYEMQCERIANNCANSGSNTVPAYSMVWTPMMAPTPQNSPFMNVFVEPGPNPNQVSSLVRPAGLPSKTNPQFDPCTGQESGWQRSFDCGNILQGSAPPPMPNMNSGCYPTQFYPMAPGAYISEPPPKNQCSNATRTLANSRHASATNVSNAAENGLPKRNDNAATSRVTFKLQNQRNHCPQKLIKPNKRSTSGLPCQCDVADAERERNRTRTCCQIRVKDKTNSPPCTRPVGKYGAKKPNIGGMNQNKNPRHCCLCKDKKKAETTSSYKRNTPVSSKEKPCNCKQPTKSRPEFVHCAMEKPNLLERICNSMQIPQPPESCYILLPLTIGPTRAQGTETTHSQINGPVRCTDEDTKSTCSDRSKPSRSMRSCGCNTDVYIMGDKITTDIEDETMSHGTCDTFSDRLRRTYYFNPYTGYFHPWYSPSYYCSGCSESGVPSSPTSAWPSTKSKASLPYSSRRSQSCSPSKSPEYLSNGAAHRAIYRPATISKPPSASNSCPIYPTTY